MSNLYDTRRKILVPDNSQSMLETLACIEEHLADLVNLYPEEATYHADRILSDVEKLKALVILERAK